MKITRLLIFIAALLIVIPAFTGCSNAMPFEQVSICTGVNDDGSPKAPVSVLSPDTVDIYCSVKLSSISDRSDVKAEWYITQSEDAQYSDYLIGNETIAAGKPYIVFGFSRADKVLPVGEYEIKLYYDDKFIQSVPFKVSGEPSAPAAILSEATMCTSIDQLSGKPLDKNNVFPNDSSVLICTTRVHGASFGTNIKARWKYLEGELEGIKDMEIYTASAKAEGREYMSFSISPSAGKSFPIGNYAVELMVEDTVQQTVEFKVVDWSKVSGPFISEAVTFSYTDEEQQDIEAKSKFAATVNEIGVKARTYNVPSGTELSVKWILLRSDDAVYADYLMKEDAIAIEGTAPVIAVIKRGENDFPKGDYLVKMAINDKEVLSIPFRVE